MKKFRPSLLSVFLVLLLAACKNQTKTTTPSLSKELTLAIGGEPDEGFDPTTGWGRYGSPLFQSTLLKSDKDFNLEKDLATDYVLSDDGLTWTIKIRDDVKFTDGKPLTAEDVAYTFQTTQKSASMVDLNDLDSVEIIDDYQLKFHLKKRNSLFVFHLAQLGIVPKHAHHQDYSQNPIGSGPYQFVQWDKGQQLIVKRNENYYGKMPYFEKLIFLFLSEDASYAAAQTGGVDVVAIKPELANRTIDGMKLIALKSVDNRGIVLPFVKRSAENNHGAPIGNDVTADIAVRQAMNMAVNRKALVDGVLYGYGTPAYTIADGLPWSNDIQIDDNKMTEAQQLLDNAGWQKGKNGVREKNGLKADFNLYYPAGDGLRQSLSIAFADQMKALGISITTSGKSWNEISKLMHANAVLMGLGSHSPIEVYNAFSSEMRGEGLSNVNYYSNPQVDVYFEKALEATTAESANAYWKKAQWDGKTGYSVKADAPWVWLVNMDHLFLINENLEIGPQKLQPHDHSWPLTDFIENWHWKKQ